MDCGFACDLPVPRIAQPLSMRAVAWYRSVHVGGLAPQEHPVDIVEELLGAREVTHRIDRGVDHSSFEVVRTEFPGPSFDDDLPEPEPREAGLIDLFAVPFQHVSQHGVFVVLVAKPARDLVPPGAVDFHPDPAGEILSKVHFVSAGARLPNRGRPKRLHDAIGRSHLGTQGACRRADHLGVLPSGVVVPGTAPSVLLEPGVVDLAPEHLVVDDGAPVHSPGIVADDGHIADLRSRHLSLQQHPGRAVPEFAFDGPGPLVVPAVAQDDPQHVFSRTQ